MTTRGGRRAALIGVGSISHWHVRALRAGGVEVTAVSTRPGSTRLHEFAVAHAIPRVFDRWERLLEARDAWDGVVIATHTDGTAEIAAAALESGAPLLVEKPVAWSSTTLARLRGREHDAVIVGFNRRYYRPVAVLREECRRWTPALAHLELPESVGPAAESPGVNRLAPFFSNSCHGFDLLRFVFGRLHVDTIARLANDRGDLSAVAAVVRSERGDVITLTCNWSTPANFALTVDRPGRRLELRPFECLTRYDAMDVLEPSDEVPVRRYVPRVASRVLVDDVDRHEKPGFVQQAKAFAAMLDGHARPREAATLDDAEAALRMCEALAGGSYAGG